MRSSTGVYPLRVDIVTLEAKYGGNASHICEAILSYLALLDDHPSIASQGRKPVRVFRRFKNQLENDFKTTVLRFASLFDKIVGSTTLFGSGSITGDYCTEMVDTPIFREYHHWYKTGDPVFLGFVTTFLLYCKKVAYQDEAFNQTAFRGWLENEERLAALSLPDLTGLKTVMSVLTRNFTPSNPYGKFGPGAVSERYKGSIGKSSSFRMSPMLARAFTRGNIFTEFKARVPLKGVPSMRFHSLKRRRSKVSRLTFVAKDLKTSRSICIEPNADMFFQQMVLKDFLNIFEGDLSNFIDLHDQSRNQRAALYGSITGELDTLDLSSASDLLSMDLVKRIMPRKVLYWLLATRSKRVLTKDGTEHILNKFAPMGSALCFPVQCLVFFGVIVYCSTIWNKNGDLWTTDIDERDVEETLRSYEPSMARSTVRFLHSPLVYGDDLVTDYRISEMVIQVLESLGFKVNTSKSYFSSCAFRESCGEFYWNGFYITPLRFLIKPDWGANRISQYASNVAHINTCFDHGRFMLRKHHIQRTRHLFHPWPLYFTSSEEDSLGVKTLGIAYNPHLRTRNLHTDKYDLDRAEVRRILSMPKDKNTSYAAGFELYRYAQWWSAVTGAGEEERRNTFASNSDLRDSRAVWRWTPIRR